MYLFNHLFICYHIQELEFTSFAIGTVRQIVHTKEIERQLTQKFSASKSNMLAQKIIRHDASQPANILCSTNVSPSQVALACHPSGSVKVVRMPVCGSLGPGPVVAFAACPFQVFEQWPRSLQHLWTVDNTYSIMLGHCTAGPFRPLADHHLFLLFVSYFFLCQATAWQAHLGLWQTTPVFIICFLIPFYVFIVSVIFRA